jgi:hypothetical protein
VSLADIDPAKQGHVVTIQNYLKGTEGLNMYRNTTYRTSNNTGKFISLFLWSDT